MSLFTSWFRKRSRTTSPGRAHVRLGLTVLEARENPTSMYSLTWLGTSAAGDNYSTAAAISDNGQVVGTTGVQHPGITNGMQDAVGPYQAFSWTANGGMVGLGTLNGSESYATAVNNSGKIAGTYNYYTIPYQPNGGGYYEWAWSGQAGNLQTIPGHNQIGGHSRAQGINDAGVVVGVSDPTGLAFKYDGTTFTTLGTLGGQWSQGLDINNSGWVAGFADTGANPSTQPGVYQSYYHATIWSPTGAITDLGTLGTESYATKINDTGLVVGYAIAVDQTLGYAQYHPFLYNGSSMIDIGANLAGNGFASSINNAGQIVGGSGNPTTNKAWLYENGAMYDLSTLVAGGLGASTFSDATDINNVGQVVGTGLHNGHTEAFLLTPTASQTPTVTVTGGSFVYDAAAHSATATATGAGGAAVNGSFTFTYNGSATLPVNAGAYTVVASFTSTDPAYGNSTGTGTLTVTPATPGVTVVGGSVVYDGATHPATATATGVGGAAVSGSFAFTYNGSATPPTNAGTYAVNSTFTSTNPNYSNGTGTATLTITSTGGSVSATGLNVAATAGAPVTAPVATFTNVDLAHTAGSYAAVITWGDGSMSEGVVTGTGTTLTVIGTHTYANPGTDAIRVVIHDTLGVATDGTATSTATVTALGQATGKTKGAEFWHKASGQTLITSFNGGASHTELASWLATNFPNLYGASAGINNLSGKTNVDVASLFQQLWQTVGDGAASQVLATALNVYATTTSLGGGQGAGYGFQVSATGHGARSFNVGLDGAAVGVANGTSLNVFQMLRAANDRAVNGVLYNGNGSLLGMGKHLFDELNTI